MEGSSLGQAEGVLGAGATHLLETQVDLLLWQAASNPWRSGREKGGKKAGSANPRAG
jgi:hypothetical protein